MSYATIFDKLILQRARKKALLQNLQESVVEILRNRFKQVPNSLIEMLQRIDDSKVLMLFYKKAVLVNSLEEFKQLLEKKNDESQPPVIRTPTES